MAAASMESGATDVITDTLAEWSDRLLHPEKLTRWMHTRRHAAAPGIDYTLPSSRTRVHTASVLV
jgi:hypothetical protein